VKGQKGLEWHSSTCKLSTSCSMLADCHLITHMTFELRVTPNTTATEVFGERNCHIFKICQC